MKYYYIMGAFEECWRGSSLNEALEVFEDEQYDELHEVISILGIDIKDKEILSRWKD